MGWVELQFLNETLNFDLEILVANPVWISSTEGVLRLAEDFGVRRNDGATPCTCTLSFWCQKAGGGERLELILEKRVRLLGVRNWVRERVCLILKFELGLKLNLTGNQKKKEKRKKKRT